LWSKKKFIKALSIFAASFLSTAKRLFANFTPRSKSIQPLISANSQCSFGLKLNSLGVKTFLISILSSSLLPSGTISSGKFGIVSARAFNFLSNSSATLLSSLASSFRVSNFAFSSLISLP